MNPSERQRIEGELASIREQGLYKTERVITTPQSSSIRTDDGREVLNFCANNYLGLADHPEVIAAAKQALDTHGFGLASVRFICGTQDLHKQLEATISRYFGTDDTILYTSCFDANGGLFETLLGEQDAVISDALGRSVKLKVSAHALRTVEHRGGLDAFLLKADESELSTNAKALRKEIRAALAA